MKTLAQRFSDLKVKVGGNREKMGFENTFGATREEKAHITPPSLGNLRILSELNYALALSAERGNRFDGYIDAAISLLEGEISREGVLTNSACMEAEDMLMPLQEAAKEYEVIYVGHAHIDMNWKWGWQETVACTLATFQTVLHLMEEYPEFTFMQSQGAAYKIIETYAPEMMGPIQARIREGRWEVTASAWVETDKNMPDAESLIHHITHTRKYLKDVWGIDPDSVKVDFSPDTFGHCLTVPEINRFEGVPYYYHCRGLAEIETLYRYRSPSGAEVLAYKEPYWYNSGVNPDNGTGIIGLSKRCAGLKTGLIVYGVGDHGGGPTRRDIERILEMRTWPIFPRMRFGTLHEFFRKAESVRENLHVIDHELNPMFPGCYTTQSRIKLGNRKCEAALADASRLCALSSKLGLIEYPHAHFEKAWENVLFTHFHDILPGSCVQESREYAMGLFADALAHVQTAQSAAMRAISGAVDTSAFGAGEDISQTQAEGAGAGYGLEQYGGVPNPERGAGRTRVYTVFNTSAKARRTIVRVTLWDYTGDLRRLKVSDAEGNPLRFELVEREMQWYWDHRMIHVNVEVDVPALGWTVIVLSERELERYPTYYQDDVRADRPLGNIVLENSHLRAEFHGGSGELLSLIDKDTGLEQLSAPAGLAVVLAERRTNNAWHIGRHLKTLPVRDTTAIRPNGSALCPGFEMEQSVLSSKIRTQVALEGEARELSFSFEIDWNEAAAQGGNVPVLVYRIPAAGNPEKMLCDIPAGSIVREAAAIDQPCQTFAAALGDSVTPVVMTDCKYGYRLHEHVLSCTFINSSCDPDPYPDRGIHKVRLWLGAGCADPLELRRRTDALLRPVTAMSAGIHPGTLPAKASLLTFRSRSSMLSGVEIDSEGRLCIRAYEMLGQSDTIELDLPFVPKGVLGGTFRGQTVSLPAEPYRLAEVRIW